MGTTNLPTNYVLQNQSQSKNPVIVLKIDGLTDVLSSRPLQTKILYGDPQVLYGGDGLVYGGFRPYSEFNEDGSLSTFRDLLDLDGSSLTLGQRLEPEQGKSSVSTLTLAFIDLNDYMTQLVSPGVLLTDPLLSGCEVYLGFENTSYPQDYFKIFRGYISEIDSGPGVVSLQISDANIKLRTTLFFIVQTELTTTLSATDTVLNVVQNDSFFSQVPQPDGSNYQKSIRTYCLVDSEWIECQPIFQDNEKYTLYMQGLIYTAAYGFSSNVSLNYISGGTAGSEIVTVDETEITIEIEDGVSTAQQIANAISESLSALELVSVYVYFPEASSTQTTQTQTFLAASNYSEAVIQGILYLEQPGQSGVTITYASGGTAGAETITIVGNAITINMQPGISTAQNIYNAFINYYSTVSVLVRAQLLFHAEAIVQTTVSATAFSLAEPGSQLAVVTRGARGTTADIHDNGSTVASGIQVGDEVFTENAMDMALKIMLSGNGGPWIDGVQIQNIGINPDPEPALTTTSAITFPNGVDVIDKYGLVAGDYIYINGATNDSNNASPLVIVRFADLDDQSNRVIFVSTTLIKELVTTATVSFRSQYDVYPRDAGLLLTPIDVDVDQHNYIKNTFLGIVGNNLVFFIYNQEDSGKDFIQSEIYFPIGAYGLTRYGKLSCGYNSPPIANQTITVLNPDNIINPNKITVSRAANNRTLFNEIDLSYAPDDQGNFTKVFNEVSSGSLNNLGGFTNVLPINSRGLFFDYPANLIQRFVGFLLQRYAYGASIIPIDVNWEAGSVIESGDTVILDDSQGILQITNFATGERGLGKQLFNVIDRTFDFKTGYISLQLQGNIGATINDRFATISPSSVVGVGSTTDTIIITDSFGALYPDNESKKWVNYIGLPIIVHSFDWTQSATVTLLSIDTSNIYMLHTTLIPFTPAQGYIVDIDNYPTSNDPTLEELYKIMFVHLDPTVFVVSGIDNRNFTVSGGDISKFLVGAILRIHSYDYTIDSGEIAVKLIVGNQITTDQEIGFTPSTGQLIDLIGFQDGGAAYRFL